MLDGTLGPRPPSCRTFSVLVYVTASKATQHPVFSELGWLEICFPRTVSSDECSLNYTLGKAGLNQYLSPSPQPYPPTPPTSLLP